jgi:hypothetical protein
MVQMTYSRRRFSPTEHSQSDAAEARITRCGNLSPACSPQSYRTCRHGRTMIRNGAEPVRRRRRSCRLRSRSVRKGLVRRCRRRLPQSCRGECAMRQTRGARSGRPGNVSRLLAGASADARLRGGKRTTGSRAPPVSASHPFLPVGIRIDPRSSAELNITPRAYLPRCSRRRQTGPVGSLPGPQETSVHCRGPNPPKVRIVPDKPEIERLQGVQEQRAKHEGEEAERASEPAERGPHERRADKAAYLRDRLDDQAAASDE